jgi:choline dehydrogenase-like flavoprotein
VLAGGGMASAQLLLNSDARHAGGIGNQGGALGRYLMDHPLLIGGEIHPTSADLFARSALYDMRQVRGAHVMAHLQIADEVLEREPVLGLSMMIFPRERNYLAHRELNERQQLGVNAFYNLRQTVAHGAKLEPQTVGALLRGADGIVKRSMDEVLFPKARLNVGGWSRMPLKRIRYHSYEVLQQVEQAPHSDNRVSLSHERDALGMRRLVVDWRWHDEDQAATMRAQDLYAEEVHRAGLGEFRIARPDGKPHVFLDSCAHYMGITRMHSDPQRGVVDADCRVHGVSNLSIVSSSVFPTGGFANPTLTIVALALRTADRLKADLAQGVVPQRVLVAA